MLIGIVSYLAICFVRWTEGVSVYKQGVLIDRPIKNLGTANILSFVLDVYTF